MRVGEEEGGKKDSSCEGPGLREFYNSNKPYTRAGPP